MAAGTTSSAKPAPPASPRPRSSSAASAPRPTVPRAATPAKRLQAIELLSRAGVATAAMVAPVIPALAAGAQEKEPKTGTIELFNGKNLKGWTHFLVEKDVKKKDVWSVTDGVLVCKGEPLGYLQTKESFESFRLQLDWRWAPGGEPGNSGVLFRIEGKAKSILPRSFLNLDLISHVSSFIERWPRPGISQREIAFIFVREKDTTHQCAFSETLTMA